MQYNLTMSDTFIVKDVWQWIYAHIIHWPYHVPPPSHPEQVAIQNSVMAF